MLESCKVKKFIGLIIIKLSFWTEWRISS